MVKAGERHQTAVGCVDQIPFAQQQLVVGTTDCANQDRIEAREPALQYDIRTGEAADRRAAQVEAITAATFWSVRDKIGKKVKDPKELGLPDPANFDSWWPPKGYKPRMS